MKRFIDLNGEKIKVAKDLIDNGIDEFTAFQISSTVVNAKHYQIDN